MPIPGRGASARVRWTMSQRGEIEREAVETIERASEGAGVQLDVKLGRGRAQLLQVSAAEKHTPWYREARGIVSALALTVSAASLAYAWRSDGAAEIRQKRQEIRQIVQELTEMRLRYVADLGRFTDPQQQRDIGKILQAKQSILLEAAEVLADDIPKQVTSSAYRTLAWENVYDERLAQAELFFRAALDASRTPTGRAYAYRDLGTFYAAYLDKVEQAREMFQLGVKQLEGGWDPAAQLALADTYGTWSAMEADKGDAAWGRGRSGSRGCCTCRPSRPCSASSRSWPPWSRCSGTRAARPRSDTRGACRPRPRTG